MLNPTLIAISVISVFFIIPILIIKLAKVHQHKAQLETDLAQAQKKNNRLSNQLEQKHHHNMNLKNKLEQERQRNANLESSLTQVNQKTEDFSSKNTPLASELKQERQRITNLEKKLATSNFSLDQSRQHNERLTGELTQANQRNANLESNQKRLSVELRQKRENKIKLEKELKLSGSSAYRILLDAIYAAGRIKTDEQKQTLLNNLLKASEELSREYQQHNVSPDYSKPYYQEAYLLRYFLPYSQPVPYLLNHLILQKNFPYQLPEDGTLTASFFGCGPGPELYGLMHYLGGPQSSVDISAAMLDIAPWKNARKIVFEHLLRSTEIHEFRSNLVGNPRDFLPNDSEKWVSKSDLLVIQHCLNEKHNAQNEQLLENLKQIVRKMKSGAVMLIIERARYPDVKELLGKFCFELKDKFDHSVDFKTEIESRDGVDLKPILQVIPKELRTVFLERSLQIP
ncbi:MAG: hypothetical protein OXH00_24590 [Candidatus Poribacteria bacterium]|nr:hypothetical protein [Candidatus Poribacteria bacterium]